MEKLRTLSDLAKENSIKLCLENTEESPREMLEIIDAVPDLLFCLDIGHGNLFMNKPSDFIERLHGYMCHVHIHDNFGGMGEEFDRHLVPGEGSIDFDKVFRSLNIVGYRDTITLELTPHDSLDRKIQALTKTRNLIKQYPR